MTTERVLVISPRKSGTHLIQELMVQLGFRIYGEPVPPSEGRPAFSIAERQELAERFLDRSELAELDHRRDRAGFLQTTDQLWHELAWAWQVRLAVAPLAHVEAVAPESVLKLKTNGSFWTSRFSETPAGMSWIFHSADVWRMDNTFLAEWLHSGSPKVILNYRDPRDALLSLVNFFSKQNGLDFIRYPESAIFGPTMESLGSLTEKLEYAITDPNMPLLDDFRSAMTLLRHPNVCKVSFEELVGPEGGGSRAGQLAAVGRVAEWLDLDVDREAVADSVFNKKSFTLNKGQIGRWREAFTPELTARFESRYGDVLDAFGYARGTAGLPEGPV
ncbi:sulfotransferase domain-containing protein [Streptomyces sp. NPDC059443]|uniref:sulfotransferase domain-containing protein n=1 Tax=unclassified Streptomyces TaxID=2593676 RepID=UPI0036772F69